MKVVFIGSDPRITEVARLGVRLRWPDASIYPVEQAMAGLETVERETPDVVLMHPDFTDLTLSKTIQEFPAPRFLYRNQSDEKFPLAQGPYSRDGRGT